MKRIVGLIGIAVLLVTAGCLGQTTVQANDGGDPAGTITVSGTGELTADPDMAVVRLTVLAVADSADEARAEVAADAESMRDAIRAAGIPDDAVSTESFFIGEDYRERDGDVTQWRAMHTFRVEIADLDRTGAVIDAAVSNGADQVSGVQFTLSDEVRQDLRDDAVAAAVDAARADANAAADAAGLQVTGVHSMTVGNGGGIVIPYATEAMDGAGASTVLEPGTVRVTAYVTVVYETNA